MRIPDKIAMWTICFIIVACTLGLLWGMISSSYGVFQTKDRIDFLESRIGIIENKVGL